MPSLLESIIEAFIAARPGTKDDTGKLLAVVAALLRGKGLAVELGAGSWAYYDGDQLVRTAKVDLFICDEQHSAVIDVNRSGPRENRPAKLRGAAADFKVLILRQSAEILGLHAVLGIQHGDIWKADPIEVPEESSNDPARLSRRLRRGMDEFIRHENASRASRVAELPLRDFNRFMKHRIVKATIERRQTIVREAMAEAESTR